MHQQEQLEVRSVKRTNGVLQYRFCPACRRDVIMPCVKCRAEAWLAARAAERVEEEGVRCQVSGEEGVR